MAERRRKVVGRMGTFRVVVVVVVVVIVIGMILDDDVVSSRLGVSRVQFVCDAAPMMTTTTTTTPVMTPKESTDPRLLTVLKPFLVDCWGGIDDDLDDDDDDCSGIALPDDPFLDPLVLRFRMEDDGDVKECRHNPYASSEYAAGSGHWYGESFLLSCNFQLDRYDYGNDNVNQDVNQDDDDDDEKDPNLIRTTKDVVFGTITDDRNVYRLWPDDKGVMRATSKPYWEFPPEAEPRPEDFVRTRNRRLHPHPHEDQQQQQHQQQQQQQQQQQHPQLRQGRSLEASSRAITNHHHHHHDDNIVGDLHDDLNDVDLHNDPPPSKEGSSPHHDDLVVDVPIVRNDRADEAEDGGAQFPKPIHDEDEGEDGEGKGDSEGKGEEEPTEEEKSPMQILRGGRGGKRRGRKSGNRTSSLIITTNNYNNNYNNDDDDNNTTMTTTTTTTPKRQLQTSDDDDDDGRYIDVMVVWTRAAECGVSGLPRFCLLSEQTRFNMRGVIRLAFSETNTAYRNSGILTRLRQVHVYRHPTYVEGRGNDAFDDALDDITDDGDGVMDDVHRLRKRYGADVVAMIVDRSNRYCGIAWIGPNIDKMFSVISWECATGFYSFGHEIAHNFGCLHDPGSLGRCDRNDQFRFGYRDPDARFRSILGYNCRDDQCDENRGGGCPRVQRFSNPNIWYGLVKIGDSRHDNRRQINMMRATVASYFPSGGTVTGGTPPPTPSPTPPPVFATPAPVGGGGGGSGTPTSSPAMIPTTTTTTTSAPTPFPVTPGGYTCNPEFDDYSIRYSNFGFFVTGTVRCSDIDNGLDQIFYCGVVVIEIDFNGDGNYVRQQGRPRLFDICQRQCPQQTQCPPA